MDRKKLASDLEFSRKKLNELVRQLNAFEQQRQLLTQEILRLQGRISYIQELIQAIDKASKEV